MKARLDRLEAVQQVVLEISHLSASCNELAGFLRNVHQAIGRIMYAANFYVALYNDESHSVRYVYEVDEVDAPLDPDQTFPLQDPSESPTAWVILNRSPLSMTAEQDAARGWGSGTRSEHWLGHPLLSHQGHVLGAMVIQSYNANHLFSDEDQALFRMIAAHVSIALERLFSFDKLEQAVRERTQLLKREIEIRRKAENLQRALYQIAELSILVSHHERRFSRLHEIMSELMQVPNFMVAFFHEDTREFSIVYFADEVDGNATGTRFPLGKGITSYVVQQRQALLINRAELEQLIADGKIEVLGNLDSYSWMGAPLLADEQLFGVMIVQSYRPELAYTNADLELLSFIASHVAAALLRMQAAEDIQRAKQELESKNFELSQTLKALTSAQSELINQETLASLGRLVAGVAHEINTPLGICVTATSHLVEEVALLRSQFSSGQLSEQGLTEFLDICDQSLRILTTNSQRGATLVRSFKQVAVDQSHEMLREFDLRSYLEETLQALQPKLRGTSVSVQLSCAADIHMHSFPGAISQIITNLLVNSLVHGLEQRDDGRISICATQEGETLTLLFEDNGKGVSSEELRHLFEPFYTTKRGQGGSGLGTHIVYNLVTVRLGGQIRASSGVGKGLRYEISVPLRHQSSTDNDIQS
ncbi:GAF domain-containing sensor histidine kinase [Undibacterium rugosum]|uniref:sensor histidine kinase n=1 Tax=Undibacterium rugosum TaxID=2762291 RepID=UPI001B83307F|nr:GAF domain-containing sensor histidine kinase [Undibacterium rugosum]MBR7777707.1 GAF domain-containing protein [Undibacterium rugosum]